MTQGTRSLIMGSISYPTSSLQLQRLPRVRIGEESSSTDVASEMKHLLENDTMPEHNLGR